MVIKIAAAASAAVAAVALVAGLLGSRAATAGEGEGFFLGCAIGDPQ